jgi:group II intron reverse transcriptase/maturase
METKLERITQLSKENPDMVFTSIGHLINIGMLKDCHARMDGDKAVGIDGITKEEYGRKLDENLNDLIDRMKRKAYHPKPARRVEIPKDNGKTRPLNIYCYEDKLVQEAIKRVVEAVFEPCFYEEMMGFRPNRGCHDALRVLDNQIGGHKTSWVLDADIRGFFDNIDHVWMMKFVGARIKDPRVLRLIRVMLKAGVVKDMGEIEPTEQGSGQGGLCRARHNDPYEEINIMPS